MGVATDTPRLRRTFAMRIRALFIPILVLIALVAVTACSSGAGATPTPAAATPSPAASASPDESSPSTGSATVMVAKNATHGDILVDGEGRTLYLFTPDEAGTPTCYEGCAAAWPPLLAEGDITVGPGLDDGDFSTATRTDGGNQVKIGNWPLYYFANDPNPGDTNGQGLNDKWYVVSPAGEAIK
jgi:predicted lipoprotein with Yx(FWY)xxD motif